MDGTPEASSAPGRATRRWERTAGRPSIASNQFLRPRWVAAATQSAPPLVVRGNKLDGGLGQGRIEAMDGSRSPSRNPLCALPSSFPTKEPLPLRTGRLCL